MSMFITDSHPAQPDPLPSLATRSSAAIAVIVGALVLIGWRLESPTLVSMIPGLVPMNPATAVAFVLAGVALFVLGRKSVSRGARAFGCCFAALVTLVGLLKIGEHFNLWTVAIDQVLFREKLLTVPYAPNRMAPNTALSFLMLGPAIVLLDVETGRGRRPAQLLALALAVICLMAISGYAYHTFAARHDGTPIPMALHTACTLAALVAGILLARPHQGVMATIMSSDLGGTTARRLLLAAVCVPLALGWLRLLGQRAGLYTTEYGTSLFAVSIIIVLSAMIWTHARALDRIAGERQRAVEERERFFNLSLDLMCIAGTDGYFKRLNAAWEHTLGYNLDQLLGRPFLELVHPDDREATAAEAAKLAAGENTISFENRYGCRDGSYRWLLWNAISSPDRTLIYAAARDITERKLAEQAISDLNEALKEQNAQLQAANGELEAFSYSVSHDLRAPLRSIDGFSQALLEDYAEKLDDEGKDSLQRVRGASQRMGRLIDDMLNLSRVTRVEMCRERVDLSEMARAIASDLRKSDARRQVEFVIADGMVVQADPRLVRVALDNLLGNAWKFTGKATATRIEVGCSGHNGSTVYFVRDNGAGFDMAFAGKLFGAFQRLHAMTEFPGTGVGLATVQRIVHRHGGRVWAEGEVGKGATFSFVL